MQIIAKANRIRISPRKVSLVAGLVRGLKINDALDQLQFCNKKAAKMMSKLVLSGVANAEHNYKLDKSNLFVKEIRVGKSFTMKRWMPRAHGRATPLRKIMSNVDLVLQELVDSGKVDARKDKIDAPIKLGETPKETKDVIKEDKKVAKKEIDNKKVDITEGKGENIVDKRSQGRGGHTKVEGGVKGFASKMFRRKSG